MYVIVIGATPVGVKLTQNLVKNKHDVVVVDRRKDECNFVYAQTGCITINGNATEVDVLEAAGISKANLLVATLDEDSENLVVCMLAKKFKVPKIVTRITDPKYADAFNIAGISAVAGYTDIMFDEMMEAIQPPSLRRLERVGNMTVVIVRVEKGAEFENKTVGGFSRIRRFPESFVGSAVFRKRDGRMEVLLPEEAGRVKADDEVLATIDSTEIDKLVRFLE